MERDDHSLLIAMHRGDQAAAAALWNRHASRLLAYACTILPSGDAEDAVQDAVLRALHSDHATVADVRDVRAWLVTLVRRATLNRLRAVRRRASHERFAGHDALRFEAPVDADAVSLALVRLPRRLREVVVLRHVCGLTLAQCAVALAANPNTIASRYREATGALREVLAQSRGSSDSFRHQAKVLHG